MDLECGEDCVKKDELTVPVMVISPHGQAMTLGIGFVYGLLGNILAALDMDLRKF